VGESQGCCRFACVEQTTQLNFPPGEGIEQRPVAVLCLGQVLVRGAGLCKERTVAGLACGPGQQCKSRTTIPVARRTVYCLLKQSDGLRRVPGFTQLIAMHLQRVRCQVGRGIQMTRSRQTLGRPPRRYPKALIRQHRPQAHPKADPRLPEDRQRGLFQMAFCGTSLQPCDQWP
jgi:hypothetical protein